jgi:hypothetical protein
MTGLLPLALAQRELCLADSWIPPITRSADSTGRETTELIAMPDGSGFASFVCASLVISSGDRDHTRLSTAGYILKAL